MIILRYTYRTFMSVWVTEQIIMGESQRVIEGKNDSAQNIKQFIVLIYQCNFYCTIWFEIFGSTNEILFCYWDELVFHLSLWISLKWIKLYLENGWIVKSWRNFFKWVERVDCVSGLLSMTKTPTFENLFDSIKFNSWETGNQNIFRENWKTI